MSDLAIAAATAREKMNKGNPAAVGGPTPAERKRIPLSVPQRKLEVPDIPGYHLRWFRGTSTRVAQAQRAGFEFVRPQEVELNNVSLGGDATKAGNASLGDIVAVIEGSEVDAQGQAVQMILMKQKMEHKLEDDALIQQRNDNVRDALVGQLATGQIGAGTTERPEDRAARYVPGGNKIPELFRKKTAARR